KLGALTHHRQRRELPAFVLVEAQRIGERGDHARRRWGVAALLEPDEVVDAEPCEGRDFFSAQTRGSAAAAVRQSDVSRLELLTAGAGEHRHKGPPKSMRGGTPQLPGPR